MSTDTGVQLITHVMHVRKENICNKTRSPKIQSSFIIGATLKGKNLLTEGVNSFL